MTLFGKPVSAYIAFSKGVALLVLAIGIARLALSLGGVPNSTTKWFTMNGVLFIGLLYLAIRVHTTGFGSYKQLLPALVLPSLMLHLIAITGIVIGSVTGHDNVFTTPEYAFGGDGKTLLHAGAHLMIGIPSSTVINWLIGCLILFITKKLVRRRSA